MHTAKLNTRGASLLAEIGKQITPELTDVKTFPVLMSNVGKNIGGKKLAAMFGTTLELAEVIKQYSADAGKTPNALKRVAATFKPDAEIIDDLPANLVCELKRAEDGTPLWVKLSVTGKTEKTAEQILAAFGLRPEQIVTKFRDEVVSNLRSQIKETDVPQYLAGVVTHTGSVVWLIAPDTEDRQPELFYWMLRAGVDWNRIPQNYADMLANDLNTEPAKKESETAAS